MMKTAADYWLLTADQLWSMSELKQRCTHFIINIHVYVTWSQTKKKKGVAMVIDKSIQSVFKHKT